MASCKQNVSPDDVEIVTILSTSTGGRTKPLAKSSRNMETRSETLTLRYLPTGETGIVEIPPGNYTKGEMQKQRELCKITFLRNIRKA